VWSNTLQDGLEDEEWDESHGLDLVLNDMVQDVETESEDDDLDVDEITDLLDSLNISEEDVVDDRNLDIDGDGIITDEERDADLDGDGEISEEEKRIYYENGGWKNPYNGQSYYHHPWFDWKKTERWVNDRRAIDYWLKYRGGSANSLEKIKGNKYPEDFNSKTY